MATKMHRLKSPSEDTVRRVVNKAACEHRTTAELWETLKSTAASMNTTLTGWTLLDIAHMRKAARSAAPQVIVQAAASMASIRAELSRVYEFVHGVPLQYGDNATLLNHYLGHLDAHLEDAKDALRSSAYMLDHLRDKWEG